MYSAVANWYFKEAIIS